MNIWTRKGAAPIAPYRIHFSINGGDQGIRLVKECSKWRWRRSTGARGTTTRQPAAFHYLFISVVCSMEKYLYNLSKSTPSVPNYKTFQQSWSVKVFYIWTNLYNRIMILLYKLSTIKFFINYIFIVHQFDIINFYISLYNFGQIWNCFDSPRFLKCLIV